MNWTSPKLKIFVRGHYQEKEKTIHRMGENICKPSIQLGYLVCRIYKAILTPQQQNDKQPN